MAFEGGFEEATTREISIPDRSPMLFEKYILEHLAGYRLDLSTSTEIELDNLSNDADFYLLDRLKETVSQYLQSRKANDISVIQERLTRVKGDIHPFSTLVQDSDNESEDTLYNVDLHDVCLHISLERSNNPVPRRYSPEDCVEISFVVSPGGYERMHDILQIERGTGMDLTYVYNARPPGKYAPVRLKTAATFISLEDCGRHFNGTLYDLWQGLWFIQTGIAPKDPHRSGYKSFLRFCDVEESTYRPDVERGVEPYFAREWMCTHARVEVRKHADEDRETDISRVFSLQAYSMSTWRERGLTWKAYPEEADEDAESAATKS